MRGGAIGHLGFALRFRLGSVSGLGPGLGSGSGPSAWAGGFRPHHVPHPRLCRVSIETDDQSAPSDTMCLAYNAVLAAALGKAEPSCRFVKHGYYGGKCECS